MFREVHILLGRKKGGRNRMKLCIYEFPFFTEVRCYVLQFDMHAVFHLYSNAISAASMMVVTIILCIIHVGYSFSPEGFIWKYKYEYLCWWQYASFSIDLVKNEGWIHPLPSKTSVYCQDCFCNLFAQCNFQFLFPIHSFMKR